MAASNAPEFGFRPISAKPAATALVVLFGLVGVIAWSLPAWREFVIGLLGLLVPVGAAVAFLAWRDWHRGVSPASFAAQPPVRGQNEQAPTTTSAGHPLPASASAETPAVTPPVETNQPDSSGPKQFGQAFVALAAIAVGVWLAQNGLPGALTGPRLTVEDVYLLDMPGFDFGYMANCTIRNAGGGGRVKVVAELTTAENVWEKSEMIDMAAGEKRMVKIPFTEPHFLHSSIAEAKVRILATPVGTHTK